MSFLLVILLVISFVVMLAGLILTPKPRMRSSHAAPSAVRPEPGRRVVVSPVPMRASRRVEPQPLYIRPLPVVKEGGSVASISLPTMVERFYGRRRAGQPIPWTVIIVGLVSLFVLGLYSLNILLPHPVLWSLVTFYAPAPATSISQSQSHNSPQYQYNASQNLIRLGQVDQGEYNSTQEYNLWAYSACSAASMTEVINAYGHHYRVTDILKVEAQLGEITPELGLLEEVGIQRTVAQFGFKTTWGHSLSLDQIIDVANHGRPVIVGFPPDRYAGGHLLVVTGGNSSTVYLADSSLWNRHSLSRAQFLQWWEGFYAIVTPN